MGHAISIALNCKTKKKVFCFDGDGSKAMHLGALSESAKNKNIIHGHLIMEVMSQLVVKKLH